MQDVYSKVVVFIQDLENVQTAPGQKKYMKPRQHRRGSQPLNDKKLCSGMHANTSYFLLFVLFEVFISLRLGTTLPRNDTLGA